jgi:hypothetical protein
VRSARLNAPCFGVGSQLVSLSAPGEVDCKYRIGEPVDFLFDAGCAIPDRISIDRIVHEIVSGVIHRQRPELIRRRKRAFLEPKRVAIGALERPAFDISVE